MMRWPGLLAAIALVFAAPAPLLAKRKPPAAVVMPTPPVIDLATALPIIDAALADGRLEDARAVVQRALVSADSPELQLRIAEIALASNGLAEAANGFTALLGDAAKAPAPTAAPTSGDPATAATLPDTTAAPAGASIVARAQQGLGLARLRQNRLDDAIAALDAALAADPNLLRANIGRGVAADRKRDWVRADAAWARALEIAPTSPIAHNNRGWSLLLRGRHAEAEADFSVAVAGDPRLAAARTNLIFARALQGKYREAFAVSDKTTLAADLNTVGFGAMARGDNEAAQAYFERAMQKNPRFDRTAWANLQYLFDQTRDPSAALDGPASDNPAPATTQAPGQRTKSAAVPMPSGARQ